jgi:hypothetical protein
MRTGILLILLFGFGGILPMTCGKQRNDNAQKKQQSLKKEEKKVMAYAG